MLPKLTRGIYRCVGGVIGTGLFLGSAVSDIPCYCVAKLGPNLAWTNLTLCTQDAIRYGGPVGAFLGYMIVGTVVYSLCVSIGEMIAYL